MKKVLTLTAIAALTTGCASTTMTPAEHYQAEKTQYYNELNQGQHGEIIRAFAEAAAEAEQAPATEFVWQ